MITSLVFSMVLQAGAAADELDCANAMNQQDMTICARRDFEAADADLNLVWRRIIADEQANDREYNRTITDGRRMDGEAVLREAQRAWVALRDAQCTHESYESFGGTMEPMLFNDCRAQMTRARITELSTPSINR